MSSAAPAELLRSPSTPMRAQGRRIPASRMRWILIPLALCACIEISFRVFSRNALGWYEAEERAASLDPAGQQPVKFIFIGSSRVAAAINVTAFALAVTPNPSPDLRLLNMGQGNSTLIEHYLGLRDLFAASPRRFNGCTVFIEAPEYLPAMETFNSSWVHPDQPQLIIPLIRGGDLAQFWQSATTRENKIMVTTRWLMQGSAALSHREHIRESIERNGQAAFVSIGAHLHLYSIPKAEPVADLAAVGGIRTDLSAVQAARTLAIKLAKDDLQAQVPLADCDALVVHQIVALVQSIGGHVYFFRMPLSSVQSIPYRTPLRMEDRQRFAWAASRWGSPVLDVNFSSTDDDFPDLWHLRASRSAEFSRQLATSYLRAVGSNGAS